MTDYYGNSLALMTVLVFIPIIITTCIMLTYTLFIKIKKGLTK